MEDVIWPVMSNATACFRNQMSMSTVFISSDLPIEKADIEGKDAHLNFDICYVSTLQGNDSSC